MEWKAYVEGGRIDLLILKRLFPPGQGADALTFDDGDHGTCFRAVQLDQVGTVQEAHKIAMWLLRRANGVARVHNDGFRPAALMGRYEDQSGGVHAVVDVPTIEWRGAAFGSATVTTGKGDHVPPPPAPAPRQLSLGANEPNVAAALEFLGAPGPLEWFELYKVLEVIREDVKQRSEVRRGDDALVATGWTTRTDLDRFKDAANDPTIGGPSARHALRDESRERAEGPPMTQSEGRAYISGLAHSWLDSLLP